MLQTDTIALGAAVRDHHGDATGGAATTSCSSTSGPATPQAFATLYDHTAGLVYANIRCVLHDATHDEAVAGATFTEVRRQAAGSTRPGRLR